MFLRHEGKPWEFTPGQKHFLRWWYAIDDDGRFIWDEGVSAGPKGVGKTPFAAAYCWAEFLAPVRFDRWCPETGRPLAKPVGDKALVQIAAVSREQSQNTMKQLRSMLPREAADYFGIDVTSSKVSYKDKTKSAEIYTVTASGKSQEGHEPSAILFDEIHHWHLPEAKEVYETMSGNAQKTKRDNKCRPLSTSNAHQIGLDSVMETLYDKVAKAKRESKPLSVLYAVRQAPEEVDLSDPEQLLAGLREAYEDAPWAPVEDHAKAYMEGRITTERLRRFHLSQVVDGGDAWIRPAWVKRATLNDRQLLAGSRIALGFDGAENNDAVALVACEIDSDICHEVAVWTRPEKAKDDYEHPFGEIDAEVRRCFEEYEVQAFFADAYKCEAMVAKWSEDLMAPIIHRKGKRAVRASGTCAVAYNMGALSYNFMKTAELVVDAFARRTIRISGSLLQAHCLNAVRLLKQARGRPAMVFPGKRTKFSPKKVDAAHALILAWEARQKVIEQGVKPRGVMTASTYEWTTDND